MLLYLSRLVLVFVFLMTVTAIPIIHKSPLLQPVTTFTNEEISNSSPLIKFPLFGNILKEFPNFLSEISEAAPKIEKDNNKFQVIINVKDYDIKNISIFVKGDFLIIQGFENAKNDKKDLLSSKFSHVFTLPSDANAASVTATFTSDHYLVVEAVLTGMIKSETNLKINIPIISSSEVLLTLNKEEKKPNNAKQVDPMFLIIKDKDFSISKLLQQPQNLIKLSKITEFTQTPLTDQKLNTLIDDISKTSENYTPPITSTMRVDIISENVDDHPKLTLEPPIFIETIDATTYAPITEVQANLENSKSAQNINLNIKLQTSYAVQTSISPSESEKLNENKETITSLLPEVRSDIHKNDKVTQTLTKSVQNLSEVTIAPLVSIDLAKQYPKIENSDDVFKSELATTNEDVLDTITSTLPASQQETEENVILPSTTFAPLQKLYTNNKIGTGITPTVGTLSTEAMLEPIELITNSISFLESTTGKSHEYVLTNDVTNSIDKTSKDILGITQSALDNLKVNAYTLPQIKEITIENVVNLSTTTIKESLVTELDVTTLEPIQNTESYLDISKPTKDNEYFIEPPASTLEPLIITTNVIAAATLQNFSENDTNYSNTNPKTDTSFITQPYYESTDFSKPTESVQQVSLSEDTLLTDTSPTVAALTSIVTESDQMQTAQRVETVHLSDEVIEKSDKIIE